MNKFFSPSNMAFYAEDFKDDYVRAGTWPNDVVLVSSETYAQMQSGISEGKILMVGDNGCPRLIEPPVQAYDRQAAPYLAMVRSAREVTLNRLLGIGFEAMVNNDSGTVQAVISARSALLDITSVSASTVTELKASLNVEYDRITAEAPEAMRNAFVKLDLN